MYFINKEFKKILLISAPIFFSLLISCTKLALAQSDIVTCNFNYDSKSNSFTKSADNTNPNAENICKYLDENNLDPRVTYALAICVLTKNNSDGVYELQVNKSSPGCENTINKSPIAAATLPENYCTFHYDSVEKVYRSAFGDLDNCNDIPIKNQIDPKKSPSEIDCAFEYTGRITLSGKEVILNTTSSSKYCKQLLIKQVPESTPTEIHQIDYKNSSDSGFLKKDRTIEEYFPKPKKTEELNGIGAFAVLTGLSIIISLLGYAIYRMMNPNKFR